MTLTNDNVVDTEQVTATTAAVTEAMGADGRSIPPILGVDQEGGAVAHLTGVATEFPSFQQSGDVIEADPAGGPELVTTAARASGLELRQLGFTWVYAPVADVTIGLGDAAIGSRSASSDPAVAAAATVAAMDGFAESGVVSTPKHFPGHGSATEDSHDVMPVVSEPIEAAAGPGPPAVRGSGRGRRFGGDDEPPRRRRRSPRACPRAWRRRRTTSCARSWASRAWR